MSSQLVKWGGASSRTSTCYDFVTVPGSFDTGNAPTYGLSLALSRESLLERAVNLLCGQRRVLRSSIKYCTRYMIQAGRETDIRSE